MDRHRFNGHFAHGRGNKIWLFQTSRNISGGVSNSLGDLCGRPGGCHFSWTIYAACSDARHRNDFSATFT